MHRPLGLYHVNKSFQTYLIISNLYVIIHFSLTDLVKLLIEHGCDLDQTSERGRTALHMAVWNKRTTVTRMLLRYGCCPNLHDCFGDTPLMLATLRGHTHLVKILLRAGCNVHERGPERDTALHYAARHGRPECAHLLLKRGADVDSPNIWGITPLLMAAIHGNPSTAAPLLGAEAEVNIADSSNRTVLHHACKQNLTDLVFQLLLNDASPDVTDCDGNTPIVDAVHYGDPRLVTLLVRANCDIDVRGQCHIDGRQLNNCSLLELAVHRGRLDIADLLAQAGCALEPLWLCLRRRVVIDKLANQPEIANWCHRTLRTPQCLLNISRKAFRRCLQNMSFTEVTTLETRLPSALSRYLKYDDLLRTCQRTSTQMVFKFSQLQILSRKSYGIDLLWDPYSGSEYHPGE